MRIGLIDVDSKYPNLALMKLSAWHKAKGDIVRFWNPFYSFDKVYASKIFSKPSTKFIPKDTIKGGTGYDLTLSLPPEIEHIYPDYSLYGIDYAMGFITRGCINACPFCVVPKKEGKLRKVADLSEFYHDQKAVMLLDNAITDCPEAIPTLEFIRDQKIILDLQSGFNVRTISEEVASIIAKIRIIHGRQWRIAWDNLKDESRILAGIQRCFAAGIPAWKLMCYVLVGFNTSLAEDLHRVKVLTDLGVDPFIMIYQDAPNLRHLARWCNRRQIRAKCTFEEYLKQKT